jgi:hypothetical protein
VSKLAAELGGDYPLVRMLTSLLHYIGRETEKLEEEKKSVLAILEGKVSDEKERRELLEGLVDYYVERLIKVYDLTREEAELVSEFIDHYRAVPRSIERALVFANAIEKYLSLA